MPSARGPDGRARRSAVSARAPHQKKTKKSCESIPRQVEAAKSAAAPLPPRSRKLGRDATTPGADGDHGTAGLR